MARAVAAVGVFAALAGTAQAGGPEVPTPRGQVYAGLEVGSTDSLRWDAGAEWYLPGDWELGVSASKAEYDLSGGSVAATAFTAQAGHDFGSFRLTAGLGSAEIEDRSTTHSAFVAATVPYDDWRFGVAVTSRDTGLGATPFREDLGGSLGVTSGISRCDARSLGAQAQTELQRRAWRAYARVRANDYRDIDCVLAISGPGNGNGNGNGPPLHARGRALGRRLISNTLESVVGINPRLIPRETLLLESTLSVGAAVSLASGWQLGGEVYLDREWLEGKDFFTVAAYANRSLGKTWNAEFTLGYATATLEDALFAGIRMTAFVY